MTVKKAADWPQRRWRESRLCLAENRECAREGEVPVKPIFDAAREERLPAGRFNRIVGGPGWVLARSIRSS